MDIRQIVLDRLKEIGRTKYWLCQNDDIACSFSALDRWLRGDTETNTQILGDVLDVLELEIRPRKGGTA